MTSPTQRPQDPLDSGSLRLCQTSGCGNLTDPGSDVCPRCSHCEGCNVPYRDSRLEGGVNGTLICHDCLSGSYWCEECYLFTVNADTCDNGCIQLDEDLCDEAPLSVPVRPAGYYPDCRRNANGQPLMSCGCCIAYEWDDYEQEVGRPGHLIIRENQPVIRSYSYRPNYVFSGAPQRSPALFLGPEIEVEMSTSRIHNYDLETAARLANDRLGDLGYLKEDGSLSNGFEIIHHPMTYDWAMENFPWTMLPELHAAGARGNSTAGIHIHLSRTGFSSPCHIYRWMKFVYRNREMVQKVAGRQSDQWAKFDVDGHQRFHRAYAKSQRTMPPVPLTAEETQTATERYGRGWDSDRSWHLMEGTSRETYIARQLRMRSDRQTFVPYDRYSAINVTNEHTFELRIFKSSLKVPEVQSFFAFAAASVEYARQLTANKVLKERGWHWDAFEQWLTDNPKFAPLTDRLAIL
jgi:hypothetical protein